MGISHLYYSPSGPDDIGFYSLEDVFVSASVAVSEFSLSLALSLSFCLMTPFPYFLFTLGLCSSVFLSPLSTISLSDPFNSPLPRSICSSALSVLTLCSLRSPLP